MSRLAALLQKPRPLVMGIVNVTPDSFFDGGEYLQPGAALAHALDLIASGADIIDIGGESTRPGAKKISTESELARVLPVIEAVRARSDVAISLDTCKAEVMNAVNDLDIDLINDVRALQGPDSLLAAKRLNLPVCLMHMLGEPETMQDNPTYNDVVAEVYAFFETRINACLDAGIGRDRLILDVGFGFGKTTEHNLTLINQLSTFNRLGVPLLVGLSRKGTIGKIVRNRLIGSVSGALAAISRGARIVRVHDVTETVAAISVWQAFANERVSES